MHGLTFHIGHSDVGGGYTPATDGHDSGSHPYTNRGRGGSSNGHPSSFSTDHRNNQVGAPNPIFDDGSLVIRIAEAHGDGTSLSMIIHQIGKKPISSAMGTHNRLPTDPHGIPVPAPADKDDNTK